MMEPAHGIAGKQAIKGLRCVCSAPSWREGGVKHEAAECFSATRMKHALGLALFSRRRHSTIDDAVVKAG